MQKLSKSIHNSKSIINKLNLDLSGLCVATECASNVYSLTPIIALLANAKHVFICGKDSVYGKFEDNKQQIKEIIDSLAISESRYTFYKTEFPLNALKEVDILTNSYQIRPINRKLIASLKPTSVITLMWETWEFRKDDLDILACQQYNIPVIGTNESYEKIKLFDYDGYLALKLLFALGIEIHNCKIAIIGGGLVGIHIQKLFLKMGIDHVWFTETGHERTDSCFSYNDLDKMYQFAELDAILYCELENELLLTGKKSIVSFTNLKEKFPFLKIGHIAGNIDIHDLQSSQLNFAPTNIKPFGYTSYGLENLGEKPVIELLATSLKVGEIAVKSRLLGDSIEASIKKTVEYGVGQDFEGGFRNFRP